MSEDDITSLPVHQCYVRATVGAERMDVFSMKVRKPEPGDPLVAARIREAASAYLRPAELIAAGEAEGRRRVSEYRRMLAEMQEEREANPPGRNGAAPRSQERRDPRSKQDVENEEDEE